MKSPLVSAIMPLFNNEDTVARAVRSVLAQSHSELELIIVNDGSTDDSRAVAEEAIAGDPRARIVDQANAGVAAARNRGIDDSSGEFIAPIDADDMWHPEKLERQLAAFRAAPGKVGLAYCGFRKVDEADRTIGGDFLSHFSGDVLKLHLRGNFVGNGSVPLISREALGHRRYSPALRAAGAEGCEDYMLQLQLASDHGFACAPLFLSAYRRSADCMSYDAERMARSHVEMFKLLRPHLPRHVQGDLEEQLTRARVFHGLMLIRRGQSRDGWGVVAAALRDSPLPASREFMRRLMIKLAGVPVHAYNKTIGRLRQRERPTFAELSPDAA